MTTSHYAGGRQRNQWLIVLVTVSVFRNALYNPDRCRGIVLIYNLQIDNWELILLLNSSVSDKRE